MRPSSHSRNPGSIEASVQFRDGEFVNTRCFTVDVTDLMRAREEVRRKDDQLRQQEHPETAAENESACSGLQGLRGHVARARPRSVTYWIDVVHKPEKVDHGERP